MVKSETVLRRYLHCKHCNRFGIAIEEIVLNAYCEHCFPLLPQATKNRLVEKENLYKQKWSVKIYVTPYQLQQPHQASPESVPELEH